MKKYHIAFSALVFSFHIAYSQKDSVDLYFLPGQGADYRLFDSINIKGKYKAHFIQYFTPDKKIDMRQYAMALSQQIDTSRKFILVGVSLGGMLASEMSVFLKPEKVVLISSAQCRNELPLRYRFQKIIPIYELFPPWLIKKGALLMQPIIEPESRKNRKSFKTMIRAKDPKFLKRTIRMVVNWENKDCDKKLIKIHGTNDNTIPIRNVDCDYAIIGGSHMITLVRSEELNAILNRVLR